MRSTGAVVVVGLWCSMLMGGGCANALRTSGRSGVGTELSALVQAVQSADYRGDVAALHALSDSMARFVIVDEVARDARYWRGFALWRSALNGANAGAPPASLLSRLDASVVEFREALRLDPDYREAVIGLAAVLMNASHFRYPDDPVASRAQMGEALRLIADVRRVDPTNARLVFVAAGRTFWAPREAGGDRDRAIADVEAALASLPSPGTRARTLEPSWGEAELHMQLAFFKITVTPPDVSGAQRHARQALTMHPEWEYVARILLPRIDSMSRAADANREEPDMSADQHYHHEIDYIELGVTDMMQSQVFYSAAFGWEFTQYGPGYAGIRRARGGEAGGLELRTEVAAGGPLVILYSNDLEATFAKVRGAGGRITKEIFEFPGGRRFQFRDPSGNELGVWSAR